MKKWVIRNLKNIALRLNLTIFRGPKNGASDITKWCIEV